jgi:hypothetical protein
MSTSSHAEDVGSPASSSISSEARRHVWTEFDLRVVLSLLCKRDAQPTSRRRHPIRQRQGQRQRLMIDSSDEEAVLEFSTALNSALNAGHHDRDISVAEVRNMLCRLTTEKKAALAFLERQVSRRITRTAVRVFAREGLDFDGSLNEWVVGGRKQAVMERQDPARLMDRQQRQQAGK